MKKSEFLHQIRTGTVHKNSTTKDKELIDSQWVSHDQPEEEEEEVPFWKMDYEALQAKYASATDFILFSGPPMLIRHLEDIAMTDRDLRFVKVDHETCGTFGGKDFCMFAGPPVLIGHLELYGRDAPALEFIKLEHENLEPSNEEDFILIVGPPRLVKCLERLGMIQRHLNFMKMDQATKTRLVAMGSQQYLRYVRFTGPPELLGYLEGLGVIENCIRPPLLKRNMPWNPYPEQEK